MNLYDFDGTIYDGDSSLDFFFFSLSRYKKTRRCIAGIFWGLVLYIFKRIDKTAFKERFFAFLSKIPDTETLVNEFWAKSSAKIKPWYIDKKRETDIIITASPEFLILPVTQKWGVRLIASTVDPESGKFSGKNCFGSEKVRRLTEAVDMGKIENFYTDSLSDTPLCELFANSFIVKKGFLIPFSEYKEPALKKAFRLLFDPDFFLFIFCGGCGTIVNFCCSLIFTLKINGTVAYVLGYAISLFVTYTLNAKLIFKIKLSLKNFAAFVLSYLPNFAILFTFVAILLNIFALPAFIVYLAAAVFGLPITYIILKLITFKGAVKNE